MKIVRESINEKFAEKSDPIKDMGIKPKEEEIWAHELMNKLENHKITQFGGSLPIENIKMDYFSEGAADVTASVQVNQVRFDLYFALRDQRNWKSTIPEWHTEISISSPSKKGSFSVNASGKNTTPSMLIKKLSDIFNINGNSIFR